MRHKPEADPTTPPGPGHARGRAPGPRGPAAGAALAARARARGGSLGIAGRHARAGRDPRRARSCAIWRRRSTSATSLTSSSWARGASRAAARSAASSQPPSSGSCRPASTRSFPRTRAGIPSTTSRQLAFDHGEIVLAGRERLRGKLSYTNVGFALAPAAFTLSELRDLYAAALGHDVSATNLKRVLLRRNVLATTGARRESGRTGGRPAEVYRFRKRTLEITDPFATLRPPG